MGKWVRSVRKIPDKFPIGDLHYWLNSGFLVLNFDVWTNTSKSNSIRMLCQKQAYRTTIYMMAKSQTSEKWCPVNFNMLLKHGDLISRLVTSPCAPRTYPTRQVQYNHPFVQHAQVLKWLLHQLVRQVYCWQPWQASQIYGWLCMVPTSLIIAIPYHLEIGDIRGNNGWPENVLSWSEKNNTKWNIPSLVIIHLR